MKQRKERQRALSKRKSVAGQLRVWSSFDKKSPNVTTRKAIADLEAGEGKRFTSIDAVLVDLNAKT